MSKTSKIFGIGLPRTGTTSLHQALQYLGYTSIHTPLKLFKNPDHELCDNYDAFSDSPVPFIYPILDKRYPGSKFICTTRDIDSWLESIEWNVELGNVEHRLDNNIIAEMRQAYWGATKFEPKFVRQVWEKHSAGVQEYFAQRPEDLLMIDIIQGEGWEKLCPFLEQEIPSIPFPYSNQASWWRMTKARIKSLKFLFK